jgi:DUF438 domain-containing protein
MEDLGGVVPLRLKFSRGTSLMADEEQKVQTQEKSMEEKIKEGQALDKLTAPELKEIAMKIEGVTGTHAMKKEELLKIIKKNRGIPEEPAVKKGTSAEMKQALKGLREQKKKAQETKDRKQVGVLRRRINRMKKRTRKQAKA